MNHEIRGSATGDTFSAFVESLPRLGLKDHLAKIFAECRTRGCTIVEIWTTHALQSDIEQITGMTVAQIAIDPMSGGRRQWIVLRRVIGKSEKNDATTKNRIANEYTLNANDPAVRLSRTPLPQHGPPRNDLEW
ncbi:MAG: hypothetical protein WCD02_10530 [Terriglobales bacterium]